MICGIIKKTRNCEDLVCFHGVVIEGAHIIVSADDVLYIEWNFDAILSDQGAIFLIKSVNNSKVFDLIKLDHLLFHILTFLDRLVKHL